jgi:hypothetical protein
MPTDPYEGFPSGFFDRDDPSPEAEFYAPPRLVTHIELLRRAGGFTDPAVRRRTPPGPGDPLYAVTAARTAGRADARLGP